MAFVAMGQLNGCSSGSSAVTPNLPSDSTGVTPGSLSGRRFFPADNPWNRDVSADAADPNSAALISTCGASATLHPDFGTRYQGSPIGIPYVVVRGTQTKVPFHFSTTTRATQVHIQFRQMLRSKAAHRRAATVMCSSSIRTTGSSTSSTMLVLSTAVRAGQPAPVRFTCPTSRRAYIAPARHYASSRTDVNQPPMGMRVRLKSTVDISGFPASVQVILRALQKYGMFMADNGSSFYLSGAHDTRWNDDELGAMKRLHGSDFEVVKMGTIVTQ